VFWVLVWLAARLEAVGVASGRWVGPSVGLPRESERNSEARRPLTGNGRGLEMAWMPSSGGGFRRSSCPLHFGYFLHYYMDLWDARRHHGRSWHRVPRAESLTWVSGSPRLRARGLTCVAFARCRR